MSHRSVHKDRLNKLSPAISTQKYLQICHILCGEKKKVMLYNLLGFQLQFEHAKELLALLSSLFSPHLRV